MPSSIGFSRQEAAAALAAAAAAAAAVATWLASAVSSFWLTKEAAASATERSSMLGVAVGSQAAAGPACSATLRSAEQLEELLLPAQNPRRLEAQPGPRSPKKGLLAGKIRP
jgi:methyl coenzyme M reductase alpha subunit